MGDPTKSLQSDSKVEISLW